MTSWLVHSFISSFITSRREAEGSEYHLAAPKGLELIQVVGAWRTAGQEETGTATTRESHSGPAGEGSTTLWGPAARSATASDKSVLELGRRHMVPSQMLHHGGLWLDNAWCEDGGGSPVGHASLSNIPGRER